MQLGALLFGIGVVAVVAAVVPAVLSQSSAPLGPVVAAGTLLPLGFAVAFVGLLRGARTARREAIRAARRSSTPT